MKKILNKSEKKIILLGNEAIVRGALESGVEFVSTYPGTPASEIGDIFASLKIKNNFYFEYSTNEKIALEAGMGASFSGLKTLVIMKNFGINVCLDALGPFCYTGSKGAAVIVVADDPSCHSSAQWEENTRGISYLVYIPTLEPSDPQECKDFIKKAFEISEKFKTPVMLRTTTRVAHQRAPVKLGKIVMGQTRGFFAKEPKKWVTMPPRVLEMKKELLEKIKKIKEFSERSPINQIDGGLTPATFAKSDLGIICSGISYLYIKEALKELNLNLPVLKLGFFYPLPEEKIKKFIKPFKKVLAVEELESYIEREIQCLAKNVNPKLEIHGKNFLPEVDELKPEIIISAITKILNINYKLPAARANNLQIPKRTPRLCPDCPYWFIFAAIKKAIDIKKVIFGGDIGCYMLAGLAPINMQDYLFCMGSSIGIAHGIKKASNQKLISFIGDATFFHSGIPSLINAIHNQSNPLIIIMDNQTTAMTGHQPHPGIKNDNLPIIKIENIVKSCGVKNLKILDPAKDSEEFIKTIKEFFKKKEVSVIISRRACARLKS